MNKNDFIKILQEGLPEDAEIYSLSGDVFHERALVICYKVPIMSKEEQQQLQWEGLEQVMTGIDVLGTVVLEKLRRHLIIEIDKGVI